MMEEEELAWALYNFDILSIVSLVGNKNYPFSRWYLIIDPGPIDYFEKKIKTVEFSSWWFVLCIIVGI